jgi:hypothetical protein
MRRVAFGLMVSVSAIVAANPSLSADLTYPTDMRGSYNSWDEPDTPLMDFEAGLRYGYSLGRVRINDVPSAGNVHAYDDASHNLELFLRLNDGYTNTYLKAMGSYSVLLDASYSGAGGSGTSNLGEIASFATDFGYALLASDNDKFSSSLSGFVGYQYLHEGHDLDNNAALTTSGINLNALRLGVNAEAKVNAVNLEANVAALPYVMIGGATGVEGIATPVSLNGSGWGASADVFARMKVHDSVSAGVGARATYISGRGTYNDGTTSGNISSMTLWRYGILAELKAHF